MSVSYFILPTDASSLISGPYSSFLLRRFTSCHSSWWIRHTRITDDYTLALAFIGHLWPKTLLFISSVLMRNDYLSMENQPVFIYSWLYLSTESIAIIGGMRKGVMPFTITMPFQFICQRNLWYSLMLPLLSNSSNILPHLATLNVNLTSPCRFFWNECREEQAESLALAGQTSSSTYNSFGSSSKLLLSRCSSWRYSSLLQLSQAKSR
jgi:hypothetical protein